MSTPQRSRTGGGWLAGALLSLILGVGRQELDGCGDADCCDRSGSVALGVDMDLDVG